MSSILRSRWLWLVVGVLVVAAIVVGVLVYPDLRRAHAYRAIDPYQVSADNWNHAISLRDGGAVVVVTVGPELRNSIRLSYPEFFADDHQISWRYADEGKGIASTFLVGRINPRQAGIVLIDEASGRWTVIGTNDLAPRAP